VQIRKVLVRNYRGIRTADWMLPDIRFICLVGPGDSTKTTLLDVIGLVLSSRWNVQFTDADFYDCQVDKPVVLRVVIGDLPLRMRRDDAHGMELSGLLPSGELVHDPEDGAEPCVIIQLRVTRSLEPEWTVVRPGAEDEGVPIRASEREAFGLFRVDERIDAHLRWGRGSALTRLTAKSGGADAAVTSAHRAARGAVFDVPKGDMHVAAAEVAAAAAVIGGAEFTDLRPGLDPTSSSSTNALLLHDQDVPVTGHGLGTRRLCSLAIQEKASAGGEILLIDEIEHGLEPHRLHHLLRHLKQRTKAGLGQVLLTTHSPMAVEAVEAADISVVRSDGGTTTIRQVPAELDKVQGTLRAGPSAVLARRVAVCEGKTEMGVVRRFLGHWDERRAALGKASHAALGACHSFGDGSINAPVRARILQELGYPTLLMIDNDDEASNPGVVAAAASGVQIVRWEPGHAIEDEIAATLSPAGLAALVDLAAEVKDEQSVLNAIGDRLAGSPKPSELDPSTWITASRSIEDVRVAIGAAAKGRKVSGGGKEEKKAWFKQEELGELLAGLLIEHWDEIEGQPLGAGLKKLYAFVYGEELP
jgi:putative ATP-dependent endonuclease of the OLD family